MMLKLAAQPPGAVNSACGEVNHASGQPPHQAIPRFCGNNSPHKINRLAAVLQDFTSNGLTNLGQCE